MRGTVAKRIRKLVTKDFSHFPVKAYENKEHKEQYIPTGELTEQGKPKFIVVKPITTKLIENCQRALSQYVKRHYTGTSLYS